MIYFRNVSYFCIPCTISVSLPSDKHADADVPTFFVYASEPVRSDFPWRTPISTVISESDAASSLLGGKETV